MDLFHMRRYVEESEEKEDIPPNQIVQSLNSRVKNKKRKSGDEDSNGSPPKKPNEDEQKKETGRKATKKRNKKKKAKKLDSDTGFTVLGEKCNKNKSTVRRVLPHWLSNPNVVSVDYTEDQLPVDEFEGLDSELIAKLKEKGVTQLFPVQRQVIPRLLKYPLASFFRPSDICVSAPTGSGKTLAFALPIIQSIKCRVVPRVRALVILPVQDLAKQIFKVFLTYCLETGLKVKLLSVNKAFAQEQSELVKKSQSSGKIYHSLADIIITTPGRLVDHIQRTEGFSLEHLRYIIIDEADRVMEDLQNDWLTHVESAVYVGGRNRPGPKNVLNTNKRELPLQKLLFSATLSQNPEQLEELNLYEPKLFTSIVKPKDILGNQAEEGRENADLEFIGQYTTPAELTENIVVCNDPLKKPLILHHLLETMGKTKVLIFTNSIEHTHFLAVLLQEYGIVAGELSSKVSQSLK